MHGITCVVDWPGTMSFIKDLIVAVAAIVTATVACFGISKWRAEESGKADFDLARRLGKAVYQFRDALILARRPFVATSEFPEGRMPAAGSGRPEADGYVHVFNQRLEGVKQGGLEVQALRNEAEALWGKDISDKLGELLHQSATLQGAMKAIVSDKQAFGVNFRYNEDFGKKMEARVFDTGVTINDDGTDGGPNEFTTRIEKAMEDVAAYLRTKLPRTGSKSGVRSSTGL